MMRTVLFIASYLLIAFLFLQNQLWLAAVFIFIFTAMASAAWFLPLGLLLDGYFGAFYGVPWFSVGLLCWYIFSECVKPRLLVQSE